MADIAVTLLLPKLTRILENDFQFYSDDLQELKSVKLELERMSAFLRVADAREENDEEVKVWVKQIREIAQDAEDIIDEFTILKEHNHVSIIEKFSCCVRNSKVRQRVISSLKDIYQRTKDVSTQYRRLRRRFPESSPRDDALLVDEIDLVGIGQPKEKLVDWLIKGESHRQVVAVTGMPGIGKSTLMKQVYDDDQVKKRFSLHAWITVSRNYKEEDLLYDIVQQLYTAEGMPVPPADDHRKKRIKELLTNKRYLIVFDNVWNIYVWDDVKLALPSDGCGSRVVLTTRNNAVADSACSDSKKKYAMQPLQPEESLRLFCNKTFKGNACPPHLVNICEKILGKCGGLPLAIVAISGFLSTKDERRVEEWDTVSSRIGAEIEDNDALQNMRKVLSLSFHELPHYLKPCFMSLSIFPEDYRILRMRLIRLWVAEGFAEAKAGMEPEEVGNQYFHELWSRNLLQVTETTSDGRIKFCRIHDIVREIAISKSKDQNFAFIAKAGNARNGPCTDKIRRLSVHSFQDNELPFPIPNNPQLLRSLFVFEKEMGLQRVLRSFDFKLLKVLDLQGLPIETFPTQVNGLVHLKYLGLNRTKVKAVPRCVGTLQSLETLNLKHTFVTELPGEVFQLKKLRHLLLYRYGVESFATFDSKHGFKVPNGIGSLRYLQKLSFIELNQENNNTIIGELSQLTQLRRLGVMKLREEDGRSLCSSVENMQKLIALSLLSEEENGVLDLHSLVSPPQYLQRLYLSGRLGSLPPWIPNLDSLIRLHLKWSRLREDPLDHLQFLPNLGHLGLLQAYEGEKLVFRAGGFRKLKHLSIDKFEDLRSIEVEEGAMPRLKKLYILRCKKLMTVPLGIEHLKKLKQLQLVEMSQEMVKSLHDKGGDYRRVEDIPEVYCVFSDKDGWVNSSLHGHQVIPDIKPCLK